jgi:hypothetical protein
VYTGVRNLRPPGVKLPVQILDILKLPRQEEILTHIPIRPLHLALGLGAVRTTGFGAKAIMGGQGEQRRVINDLTQLGFTQYRGLHAIVEHLLGHTPELAEGLDMTTYHHVQGLAPDETPEQVAREAQNHGEQPHDPGHLRLMAEIDLELCKVDLGLPAGRRFKSPRKTGWLRRPDRAQIVSHGCVTTRIAEPLNLAQQPLS